jgi:hypothetical protein
MVSYSASRVRTHEVAVAKLARIVKAQAASGPRLKVNAPLFLSITHLKDKSNKNFISSRTISRYYIYLHIANPYKLKLKTKVMARISRMRTMFLIPFTSIIFILGWLSFWTGSTNSNKKKPKITSRNYALVKQPFENNIDSQLQSLKGYLTAHQMIFSILPRK